MAPREHKAASGKTRKNPVFLSHRPRKVITLMVDCSYPADFPELSCRTRFTAALARGFGKRLTKMA